MRRTFLPSVAILLCVVAAMPAAQAWADGMFVWKGGADLEEPNQQAIIGWDGKTETMVLAVKYAGPAEDFAWIVPVPAKPEVKVVDFEKNPFPEISRYTQVREYHQRVVADGLEKIKAPAAVEVLDRQVVGVYDIAVLAAKDAGSLAGWLNKNGYAFPEKHKDALEDYTKKEWVYVAMRIDPKQLSPGEAGRLKVGSLEPVCLTFPSKEMVYPLKISSANSGSTEVLLYLVADAPMVPAGGPSAPGMDVTAVVPRYYMDPGNVAVYGLEPKYMMPQPAVLPLTWEALGLPKGAAQHVCKYRAVYSADEMKDDLTFKPFDALAFWKARLQERDGRYNLDVIKFVLALDRSDEKLRLALARNSDRTVRVTLAENTFAGDAALRVLAADADVEVRRRAAETLQRLSTKR